MAFPSRASDGFMQNAADIPAPGEKRRAGTILPSLPAPSALGKRVTRDPSATRQRSDSCVSGLSTATGPDVLGRAIPGFAAGISSTPTSRARLEVSSASEQCAPAERGKDELRGLLESTATNAREARSNTLGARSPSATGSLTFHSISRRHASGGVKCEEELDDDEEELRGDETAQSGAKLMIDSLPQWRQPSAPATEPCTPKFGAVPAPEAHRQSPEESCAEAPVLQRGTAYEVRVAMAWKEVLPLLEGRSLLSMAAWPVLLHSWRTVLFTALLPPPSLCSNAALTRKRSSSTCSVKSPCEQEPGATWRVTSGTSLPITGASWSTGLSRCVGRLSLPACTVAGTSLMKGAEIHCRLKEEACRFRCD